MSSSIQQQIDDLLSESVEHATHREQAALDEILDRYNGRYVLFGAGNLGRRASMCLSQAGLPPLAFSDNNAHLWGTCIDGFTVLPPQEAALRYGHDAAFFVTIWNDKHRFRDTQGQLQQLACDFVFSGSPIYWRFAAEFLPHFCLDLPHKIYEQAERVRVASTLWADEESEAEFLAQLRWRAFGDFAVLRESAKGDSYFLDDIFSLIPEEVFVDGGAFDGDTIRELARRTDYNFSHAYAMEPDPQTFVRLKKYVDQNPSLSQRVSALNLAIGSARSAVRFDGSGSLGSCITDTGSVIVQCAPLDDLVRDEHPTFLKMDIEGFELEALAGAEKIITQDQPILAICAYHRQSDLWEIPLHIHKVCPDYRLFMRLHEPDAWQLVTYAVPRLRLRAN
jgi:FkbM family methyltransferase